VFPRTKEDFNERGRGYLPGLIGIKFDEVTGKRVEATLEIRRELLAPNGFLHAASVVALADTACGYGTLAGLPDTAKGFTTIELKTNFLGTSLAGTLRCIATCIHSGRTTQVWDAVVTNDADGRTLCLFRCTEMILYPK
jgi:1,4-dihydroxy-2-naphthoyl-CoA hydrolase